MNSNHRDDDFDDDMPRRRGSNGIATAAMVLGILSLILTVFAGIPAIICGAIGLSRVKETGTGNSPALAGLILGIVGCLMCPFMFIGVGLLLPAVSKVREAASRSNDSNHFKETALATYGYEETMGEFPRPFFKDQKQTNENLSWRVALLKYVDQPSKYDLSFDYTKTWDAPENLRPSPCCQNRRFAPHDSCARRGAFACRSGGFTRHARGFGCLCDRRGQHPWRSVRI